MTRELLDGRIEMLSQAFRSAIDVLREDINKVMPLTEKIEDIEGRLRFVNSCAHEAMDHVRAWEQRPQSDGSDWSLLDYAEFQELQARVEALETGSSGAPVFGSNLAGQLVDAA